MIVLAKLIHIILSNFGKILEHFNIHIEASFEASLYFFAGVTTFRDFLKGAICRPKF